ncbi:hypothetical protein RB597_007881 [Gaeumannomyces tritici]
MKTRKAASAMKKRKAASAMKKGKTDPAMKKRRTGPARKKRKVITPAASANPNSDQCSSADEARHSRITITDLPSEVIVMIARQVEAPHDLVQLAVALGPELEQLVQPEIFAADVMRYLAHAHEGPDAGIPAILPEKDTNKPSALMYGAKSRKPHICHLALDAFERVQKRHPQWRLVNYLHDLPISDLPISNVLEKAETQTSIRTCVRRGFLGVVKRLLELASAHGLPLHHEAVSAPPRAMDVKANYMGLVHLWRSMLPSNSPLSNAIPYSRQLDDAAVDAILCGRHLTSLVVDAIIYCQDEVLEYLVRRGASAVVGIPSPLNAMLCTGRIEVFQTLSLARDFQVAINTWKPESPTERQVHDIATYQPHLPKDELKLCDQQGHLFKLMMIHGYPLSATKFENILTSDKDPLRARAIAAVDADCAEYWGCRVVDGKHQFWSQMLRSPLVFYRNNYAPRRFLVRWIEGALPHWDGTKACKCNLQPNGQGNRIMRTREGFWEMIKACLAWGLICTFWFSGDQPYSLDGTGHRLTYRNDISPNMGTRQTMDETRGWIELVWNGMKKLGMTYSGEETAGLKSSFAFELMEQRRRQFTYGLKCPHEPQMMTTAQYVCVLRAAFEYKRGKLDLYKRLNVEEEVGAEKFYDW